MRLLFECGGLSWNAAVSVGTRQLVIGRGGLCSDTVVLLERGGVCSNIAVSIGTRRFVFERGGFYSDVADCVRTRRCSQISC